MSLVFNSENYISLNQFGFLKHRSTLKLLIYTNEVHRILHEHHQVDAIYPDIRKAFDSVPHNELLISGRLVSLVLHGSSWLHV